MVLTSELGFENRTARAGAHGPDPYSKPMFWVVDLAAPAVAGGATKAVVKLSENHFARKHFLLHSMNPAKLPLNNYSWSELALWALGFGDAVEARYTTYTEDKALHRVQHRAGVAPYVAGAAAPVGTAMPAGHGGAVVTPDNQHWSDKYRGQPAHTAGAPHQAVRQNSVVNLVTESQNSIDRNLAAERLATALLSLPMVVIAAGATHNHLGVNIDFQTQCVLNARHELNSVPPGSITGTAQGIVVNVHEAHCAVAGKRSFSVYHLTGTF
jgi:hypothetical protein